MIFSLEEARAIVRGEKTEYRQPALASDLAKVEGKQRGFGKGMVAVPCVDKVWRRGRVMLVNGRKYAVQPGCGVRALGSVMVVGIQLQQLKDMTNFNLAAEGVGDVRQFQARWESVHGDFDLGLWAWVTQIERY
jgi:hypothetical protein